MDENKTLGQEIETHKEDVGYAEIQ